MARQERNSVDYFPHTVSHGKKMFYLRSKYKNDGYAVWFMLLEQLGRAEYHYLDLSDDIQMMYLSSEFMVEEETLKEIINVLVKFGDFDADLWNNHRVIFNEKFVESISDAYKKRNNECISKSNLYKRLGFPNEGKSNPNEGKGNLKGAGSTQRKEKDIKEEKSKEDYDARKLKFSATLSPFLEKYGPDFLNDFYRYWTEPNKSKTKFRQELEKTWDLERRLDTWARHDKNSFSKNPQTKFEKMQTSYNEAVNPYLPKS